jgi:hypothetical protein
MKSIMTLVMVLLLAGITGCAVPEKKDVLKLSDEELAHLKAKENVVLSPDLKKRLVAHSKELKLTPEEMEVLKHTGKVILCGKCGYILNSTKYKEAQKKPKSELKDEDHSGFIDDSIRDRILGPYIN